MSKVLFIIHDNSQEDNRFPLGVAYLAAMLRKDGIDVYIYSMDVYHYTNDDLATFLSLHDFDVIGLSFTAARFNTIIKPLCKVINENKKKAWFVLGGHGSSPIPDFVLKETKADIVIVGEAEETIAQLVFCKRAKGDGIDKIPNLVIRDKDGIYSTFRKRPTLPLDRLPYPTWELFPIEKYATCIQFAHHEPNDKYLQIITSRGCVNRCAFCYRMERGYRMRSISDVVKEMNMLNDYYGINYFEILDEMFVLDKNRLQEFKNELDRYHLKIKYTCDGRVDVINDELMELLKASGCTFLNFGFESANQNVLNSMRKHTTVEQNIKAAELAKKHGIMLGLNLIWNNVGDNLQTLHEDVAFLKKYNTYFQLRTIKPVTPYPGSDLYFQAIKEGLLTGPKDFFNRFQNIDLVTVNFTDMPEEEMYKALFEVNRDLILDHYAHTTKDGAKALVLIDQLYRLYFEGDLSFRGTRDYSRANGV
jgi:radical SAM superfamily enzyme YgiQ (UPF0313 family)